MSKYIIFIFLVLFFYKNYSQEMYTDTIVVSAKDLSFKKDSGLTNVYILHFKVGMTHVSDMDSVQFSFLDAADNVVGHFGIYKVAKHVNGSYYLSSAQGNNINVVGDHISVSLPLSVIEYNQYKSLRVHYASLLSVSETFSYTISKY